jgi:8-oxo-dGTP pyrophosphatase MutT (NUDIX family)
MEQDETPIDTLNREIGEEWGINADFTNDSNPQLLTITNIESNPAGRACKTHFDIWFFLPLGSKTFAPNPNSLAVEFYQIGWKNFSQARALAKDPNTIIGINEIEKILS